MRWYHGCVYHVVLLRDHHMTLHARCLAERLGFDRKHFQGAVTSGTLAIPELNSGTYGKKCVLFTWAEGDARAERFVRQTGVEPVARVSNAQFLLAHGTQVSLLGNSILFRSLNLLPHTL